MMDHIICDEKITLNEDVQGSTFYLPNTIFLNTYRVSETYSLKSVIWRYKIIVF